MILKLIIFAIVAILIYKFFGGKFPTFGKSPHEKKLDDDTLVECTKCHTYVTVKESIVVGGKYYCSTECAP
jgi:uncharacterized protein